MFGENPLRAPVQGDGTFLDVVEIFSTLQGEGPFVGHPAVFLRLGGCNLACKFCDTEFETFQPMPISSLLEEIERLSRSDTLTNSARIRQLVVITGGEPFRQNIAPLCEALLAAGFTVQIETNGTLWRPVPRGVHIICSPKISHGAYHLLRPDLLERIDALKFIVSAEDPEYQDVGEVGQSTCPIPVYVQPMDVGDDARNAANRAHALALAETHGYRLSLQMHKLLDIR